MSQKPTNHRKDRTGRRQAEQGFSLIELTIATAVLGLALLGIVKGNLRSERSSVELQRRAQQLDHAGTLLARLDGLPFGSGTTTATADQIVEFLRPDTPVYNGIAIPSLTQLRNSSPLIVQYVNRPDGVWQVQIDADLNGDGDTLDAFEGSADLFRIQVLCDGNPILQVLQGRDPNE